VETGTVRNVSGLEPSTVLNSSHHHAETFIQSNTHQRDTSPYSSALDTTSPQIPAREKNGNANGKAPPFIPDPLLEGKMMVLSATDYNTLLPFQ
jgi:hypothetical protein